MPDYGARMVGITLRTSWLDVLLGKDELGPLLIGIYYLYEVSTDYLREPLDADPGLMVLLAAVSSVI
jgi:hypothetical protein